MAMAPRRLREPEVRPSGRARETESLMIAAYYKYFSTQTQTRT